MSRASSVDPGVATGPATDAAFPGDEEGPASTTTPVRELALRDGSRVRVGADDVTLLDPAGRVCLRWVDGHLEVSAPAGDVRFLAPSGRIVLEGAEGVELRSPGPIELRAERLRLLGRSIDVAAGVLRQRIDHVTTTARRWELRAGRLLEHARETTRVTEDLSRVEAGRMTTLARGLYQLVSRRTELTSEKDTSIDGERVLLG